MTEPTIHCPKCQTEIKLTESLAAPLIEATRRDYERRMAEKEAQVARREETLEKLKAELADRQAAIDAEIARKLQAERARIADEEGKKIRLMLENQMNEKSRELAMLKEVLQDRDAKLAEAQKTQTELMRKQRELDDAKRELELTVENRVQESLNAVREKAKLEAEAALKLKVSEKEQQIASMQREIENLKRKAEQGSQQLQGEVLEIEIEAMLRANFPRDLIEPVPKGEHGGDVLQRVVGPTGQVCGTILWESKRTKNWSDGWLAKLRDDQRSAKADFSLIVSQALPKGIDSFGQLEGVWVTEFRCAIPVAVALRHAIIEIALARKSSEGQQTKMEMIYEYLTGPRFRLRIGAIAERFSAMQADLQRERTWMMKQWAKREEQIRGVLDSTAGMYGDLQGIAGSALPEIESLDVPLLEAQTP